VGECSVTGFDELCIHIHLAHAIDDHCDFASFAIGQAMIEQRGLARAKKASEDADG
jgi:hypothetical protein